MNTKAFSMLLISMLIASTLAVAVPQALAATTVSIEPSPQTFGPGSVVGTTFTVDIMVNDVTALYGIDIQIGWDTTYIQYVSHVKHIPASGGIGILYSPTIPVKNQVDETASMPGSAPGTMYWVAEAAMLPAPQFDGTGSAATFTFRIVKQPDQGSGEPDVTTYIRITSVTLADTTGLPIPCTLVDGEIIILAMPVAPPVPVLLRIAPVHTSGIPACNTFESSILLSGTTDGTDVVPLDPKNDVAGFDIVYNFDPAWLEATSCTIDPDGWFAAFWPNGILEVKNEIDNVAGTVWIVFLGIPGDLGAHTAPYGEGRIVSITLHAIADATTYPPPTTPLTLSPTTVAGFPHPERMYPPWNGSDTSVPLDHFVRNGDYTAYFLSLGRSIDLYSCTDPHGGVGPNVPADMVWTQKGICLCVNVTYNLWPVQQKDVAFEIRDPLGNIWGIFYGRTGVDGSVCIFVRLPWPCDDPEQYIGKWKVTATVDIACTVVNDTMEFKYDYRVNIWKTTLDAASYVHGDVICVTIDYGTYSNAIFDVLFTATFVDELGVPFGFGYVWATAGGEHPWCTYINGTVVICVPIPKFAAAGIGTAYILALSDFPWNGGVAYGPVAIALPFNIEAA
jgi:hypothetical protein